jgi:hypothetical protein
MARKDYGRMAIDGLLSAVTGMSRNWFIVKME